MSPLELVLTGAVAGGITSSVLRTVLDHTTRKRKNDDLAGGSVFIREFNVYPGITSHPTGLIEATFVNEPGNWINPDDLCRDIHESSSDILGGYRLPPSERVVDTGDTETKESA